MGVFRRLMMHQRLYRQGILDLCLCGSSCPYSNMVCKNCPFSNSYHVRFRKINEDAKLMNEILKVCSASTFVNRNVFISFNDKKTLNSFI